MAMPVHGPPIKPFLPNLRNSLLTDSLPHSMHRDLLQFHIDSSGRNDPLVNPFAIDGVLFWGLIPLLFQILYLFLDPLYV